MHTLFNNFLNESQSNQAKKNISFCVSYFGEKNTLESRIKLLKVLLVFFDVDSPFGYGIKMVVKDRAVLTKYAKMLHKYEALDKEKIADIDERFEKYYKTQMPKLINIVKNGINQFKQDRIDFWIKNNENSYSDSTEEKESPEKIAQRKAIENNIYKKEIERIYNQQKEIEKENIQNSNID